jgi:hypothetical protein
MLLYILRVMADQYKDQINWVLKWAATVVTIAGALAVSYHIDPLNIYLLNIACVLWIVWALRIREWSIFTVNAVMLAIYGHGLFMRLF